MIIPKGAKLINAQIEDTMLGIEDHGCGTIMLYLHFDECCGQGFGGYMLWSPVGIVKKPREKDENHLARWVTAILEVTDSTKWEDVKGKYLRIIQSQSKVYAIGHLMKDIWFNPEDKSNSNLLIEDDSLLFD